MQNIKNFRKYLWEYDLSNFNLHQYEVFLIERVAQRCDFEDLKKLSDAFSPNKVISVLNSSKNINSSRKSLIINILK